VAARCPPAQDAKIALMMRDAFLLDPTVVFLNHGSFGACPKPVFAQFQHWQLELERNPVEFLGRRSAGLLRTHARRWPPT
jgi:isopenicillin-N epimerase